MCQQPARRVATLAQHLGPDALAPVATASDAKDAAVSKPWRLSASVVVLAPFHCVPDGPLTDKRVLDSQFDYRVCCVQRAAKASFMPETTVFPGGAVDANDVRSSRALLGTEEPEAVIRCAAIREVFEESGVMLFKPTPTCGVTELASWRSHVHNDSSHFSHLCTSLGVAPDVGSLHYWCSFITPDVEHARMKKGGFDTRFFVCCASAESVRGAAADEEETVHLAWLTPGEALAAVHEGKITMVPPQWYILKELADSCPSLASISSYAGNATRALQRDYPIKPYPVALSPSEKSSRLRRCGKDDSAKERVFSLCYPGDEFHPVFPGPAGARHRMVMVGNMGGRLHYELERGGLSLSQPLKESAPGWHRLGEL